MEAWHPLKFVSKVKRICSLHALTYFDLLGKLCGISTTVDFIQNYFWGILLAETELSSTGHA